MALRTTPVEGCDDVRKFFDRLAPHYRDSHGHGAGSLRVRLRLMEQLLADVPRGKLLEIGCGTGMHLFSLADSFVEATGIDLAPAMVVAAEQARLHHLAGSRVRLAVDRAEELASVDDASQDVVVCVGALEHMLDRPAALRQVHRVLRPGGAFICLTPNADWIWYSRIAPLLGIATRHLSTDRFLGKYELIRLLEEADLLVDRLGHWNFVPRGDMPRFWGWALVGLEVPGRLLRIPWLRGGLYCRAIRG